VKLIAITHVPTNGGLVNPAEQVGKAAKEAVIIYLLDACQSAGQMPLDVNKIGCDLLSATGRKFLRGPRATGFLYVRNNVLQSLQPPFLDLHAATWTAENEYEIRSDARRFENWEQNFAGKIGLGAAIDYAMGWGLEAIRDRVFNLAERLRSQLRQIPGVKIHDIGKVKAGIVTFDPAGKDPDQIKQQLSSRNINVTVTSRSATLLDMQDRALEKLVRASVHYFNTDEEIDRFCKALTALV
jgi:selenocysteine lyase/cysteine desulfurase